MGLLEYNLTDKEKSAPNSKRNFPVTPGQVYAAKCQAVGHKGQSYSAYFAVIFLDNNGREVMRRIRWLNDFSGRLINYEIIAAAPETASSCLIGYRINCERAVASDITLELLDLDKIYVVRGEGMKENYDEVHDYYHMYDLVDLNEDYWTVIGANTKEAYEKGAESIISLLRNEGLNPNSKILDIGCGTGRLASKLIGYLREEGAYYGVDLSKKAIEFCKSRYRRENFHFMKSEPTKLPFSSEKFDFIIFYTVFMHNYPDEIKALLQQCGELLAEDGKIIADIFLSEQIKTYIGSRASVVFNKAYFLELLDSCNLTSRDLSGSKEPESVHGRYKIFLEIKKRKQLKHKRIKDNHLT